MKNEDFNLSINDKFEFESDSLTKDGLDIQVVNKTELNLIKNGVSYTAHVLKVDVFKKEIELKVGNELFQVSIADRYDQLIKKMGLNLNITHQINDIKAPMPGLVLSIEVVEGQEIRQGDPVFVLEAMKMENVIKSPGEGRIKAIHVEKGKPVEKGEILLKME